MANPSGSDTGQEWFEVRNVRDSALDLTGLEIVAEKDDSTGPLTHIVTQAKIDAGAYFVFGDVTAATQPAYVSYGYGADLGSLRNDHGQIVLKCGTTVVAVATYEATTEGASRVFDGDGWCDAKTPFGSG